MALEDILELARQVREIDETRRSVFRRELAQFESDEAQWFPETRKCLTEERETLASLEEAIEQEKQNIDDLSSYAAFLTVEQAVEHRDATIDKLEKHNAHLETFCQEMTGALDAIQRNLEALETGGPEALTADPQPHFERAQKALEAHNEVVEGLDTNMTILNAYLT